MAVERTAPTWRPLSSTSALFFQLGRLINANSSCVLILDGPLNLPRLRQASAQLIHKHPLLRSCLVRQNGRLGWQLQTAPHPEQVPLTHHPVDEPKLSALLERVVNQAWQKPWPTPEHPHPPLALNLFTSAQHNVLQIVTSHIAEDAYASYQISHDLAQLYNGTHPEPDHVVIAPNPDMDAQLLQHTGPITWRQKSQACWWALRDLLMRDSVLPIKANPAQQGPRGFALIPISDALFERLRMAAKHQGVSLHSVLLLALCNTIQAQTPAHHLKRHIRLLDMFSLRGLLQAPALYENTVVPYLLRIRVQDEKKMLAHIHTHIAAIKASCHKVHWYRYALASQIMDRLPTWLVGKLVRASMQASVLLTNPGAISHPIEAFGSVRVLDFFTHAQLFPPGALMCQFSGFRGQLRLIFVYNQAAFEPTFEHHFQQPFLAELDRLAQVLS